MTLDHQCRWVKRRLPLLAGGELEVQERRSVERHLIGCPDCRARRDSSAEALVALHRLGEEAPPPIDAPSLWPELARQIRETRHASPPALAWWERPLPLPLGFASLAAAFGVVLVASIARPLHDPEGTPASAPPLAIESPSPSIIAAQAPMDLDEPEFLEAPRRAGALPPWPNGGLTQAPAKPIEPPSSVLRFDYDLDHGTPMTPGNHDPQRTF